MKALVSDTSVPVDLERGSLLEASFRLLHRFAVPDLLYERELKHWGGEELKRLGLSVEELDGDGVNRALAYQKREPTLSLPDCFALTLAQTRSWVLLSGDRWLRQLAAAEAVECHGVLWLFEEMCNAAVVSVRQLYDGLTAISKHRAAVFLNRRSSAGWSATTAFCTMRWNRQGSINNRLPTLIP